MYMKGQASRRKLDAADCILTGYYCGYYMNGGKKAKNPNDLIGKLFRKRQSREEGLREIERIKKMEQGGSKIG